MNDPNGTIAHGAKAPPCIMVIFGASGDLTKRLLMPAIYNLSRSGLLSDNFALVGVDRRDQSTEEFRDYLADGVRSFLSDTALGGTATPIVDRPGAAGLVREHYGAWRRVIIEKLFGNDLASAKALNARVLKVLDESQVYRMDHFLGKETVQNIMVLRFANGIFEPLWNRDHID